MSDQDDLRARIEEVIEAKTYAMASDGFIAGTEEAAQAIIDEFWLEVVSGGGRPGQRQQIVGRWEKQ